MGRIMLSIFLDALGSMLHGAAPLFQKDTPLVLVETNEKSRCEGDRTKRLLLDQYWHAASGQALDAVNRRMKLSTLGQNRPAGFR